jgi:LacI family transcriptional regulator
VQDAGLVVGRDVALIGFDDIEASRFQQSPLTTVASDPAGIGSRAAKLLSSGQGSGDEPVEVITPARLIIRSSCGCSETSPSEIG